MIKTNLKVFVLIVIGLFSAKAGVLAYDFKGIPASIMKSYTTLHGSARFLVDTYGVETVVYYDYFKGSFSVKARAQTYLASILKSEKYGKSILLVWVSYGRKKGAVLLSDEAKKIIPVADVQVLEDDVLNSLLGKWYVSDIDIMEKIVGTCAYLAAKKSNSVDALKIPEDDIVKLDDQLYRISLMNPFKAIIKLFYAEPISFLYYFPFLMYLLIVRSVGGAYGVKFYIVLNILWAGFVGLVISLIVQRANIFFPDYAMVLKLLLGSLLPVFIALYFVYKDDVEVAISNYMYNISGGGFTGGFNGKQW